MRFLMCVPLRSSSLLSLLLAIFLTTVVATGEEDVATVPPPATKDSANYAITESPISESDRDHWSFRPLIKPKIPDVSKSEWARNPIDRFILAEHHKQGFVAGPEASRTTLARRLAFDLTGLPCSVEKLTSFTSDTSEDAYEHFVDSLLTSPAYGERWGQHWLDLARFAETDGFEHDKVRPNAWRYRDWVISALNEDLPYDRFVQLQVAGDLLASSNTSQRERSDRKEQNHIEEDAAIPTMFCLSGPDMPDINDQIERRHILLNEMTATIGAAFLGLQLGCAECHDHKYDPISQADFYRMRAIFESSISPLKRDTPYPRLKEQAEPDPARFWIRGDHRRPGPVVTPAYPRIAVPPKATVRFNENKKAYNSKDSAPADSTTSPRLAFARWMTDDSNPLTARVIVNRVWQHHFGRGLFNTPSDVGLLISDPTHPELLDWLAIELKEHHWSLKWLHRTIITSATYRQASRLETTADRSSHQELWLKQLQIDPDNRFISRANRRRLDGESLRDAMLFHADLMNEQQGGPGVMPPIPKELLNTLLKGQWTTSEKQADHYRRSIYLFARRNLRYPLFEVFDRPSADASCPQRIRSTTAPQSLTLFNSPFSLQMARHLAGSIIEESQDEQSQIESLFRRVYSRTPSASESETITRYRTDERNRLSSERASIDQLALPVCVVEIKDAYSAAAFVEVCLAVLNSSEMLYID